MASQGDLKLACESIEAYQNDLDADLMNLSANLDQEIESLQTQVIVLLRRLFLISDCFAGTHRGRLRP
jgi:hypothetical protein